MGINVRTYNIDYAEYKVSQTGSIWNMHYYFMISPTFLMDNSNEVYTMDGGNGDSSIGTNSIKVDNEYIISVGWGDGIGIRKIANDGTLSLVYGDTNILNNFTYSYGHGIGIDKVNKVVYLSNYVYNGTAKYDFGGSWENTPTKTFLNTGNYAFQTGNSYDNGLEVVGDYLYFSRENASQTVQNRTNISTDTDDDLTVINYVSAGRYGLIWYDEVNNRIFNINDADGGIWVTINPEETVANGAKTYNLNTDALTNFDDDNYFKTILPDTTNGNHIWVGNYHGRFAKIDITNILNETATLPTIIYQNSKTLLAELQQFPIYQNDSGCILPNPNGYGEGPVAMPDRGHCEVFGWFDIENGLPVMINSISFFSNYDGTGRSKRAVQDGEDLYFDSAPAPVKVVAPDSTEYLAVSGYGGDGYRFRTYTTDKMALYTASNIVFGDFQLSDTANIRSVQVGNFKDDVYIPTGTTFAVHVSNNSGTDWEVYSYSTEPNHVFTTTGNTVQVKMLMTGNGKTSSYVFSATYPVVTIIGESIDNYVDTVNTSIKSRGIKGI